MRLLHQPWSVFLLAVALLAGGCVTAPPRVPVAMSPEQRVAHNTQVFDRVWDLVNRKFFDAKFRGVDWNAMRMRYRPEAEKAENADALYTVINTMLEELKESHNYAQTPQETWESKSRQRALIGIGLQRLEGKWVITHVFPGSPAEEAGVQRGWLVVARNGEPVGTQTVFNLKVGESVAYDFLDPQDQPRAITMTARLISTVFHSEMRTLADGVVYLRFDQFDLKSLRWLSAQLRAHRTAPAVVIDLRHNPGGYLFSLDFALGEFFPSAVPLGTFIRRSGSKEDEAVSQLFSARYAGRVALLTGSSSASCSEIFAHVLHHHGRAVIVGQKTAGAVIGSMRYSLPDGGRLQVAVTDYLGLDGKRLEGRGVTPDVMVPIKLADLRAGIDAELNAALAQLRLPAATAAQTQ